MNIPHFNNNLEMQRPVSSSQGYLLCRNPKKTRRFRSAFSTEQVQYLEQEFKKCPYIGNTSRQEIADVLNISERAIKIWFQNRRMKEKKDTGRDLINMNQNKIIFNLTNDQLNNGNNLQSTNDEARITTSLKVTNEDSNVNQGITNDFETGVSSRKQVFQPLVNNCYEHEITTTSADKVQSIFFKSDKDSKRGKSCEIHAQFTNDNVKSERVIRTDKTNDYVDYSSQTQEVPQDLTQRNKVISKEKLTIGNVLREPDSMPVYFQNCYTPPSVSGNIMWKPLNMNPMLPGVTVQSPYHPGSYAFMNQQNLRRSNCQCDCHLLTPQIIQDPNQAQYIPLYTFPYARPDMS